MSLVVLDKDGNLQMKTGTKDSDLNGEGDNTL